jgi:peroxiredoxin
MAEKPVEIGQAAPDFALPAANREGMVSLSDYRGKSPVLLALFRGLYCPFCRHHIARLAGTAEKLGARGVETLGVVATPPERSRLYFRFHQARFPLASDPELTTHRAYGMPGVPLTPDLFKVVDGLSLDFARKQNIPATPGSAYQALNAIDGYQPTAEDQADFDRHQAQFIGQFLIDRDGVVRWVNVERAPGEFPSEAEFLAAVTAA